MSDELTLTHIPQVKVGMLIRKPPTEVFQALVDPAITTKFWFTNSTGALAPGARVQWRWEMYDVTTEVVVKDYEADRRLLIEWGQGDEFTTVEFTFTPWDDDATYVEVTERGIGGKGGDEIMARVAGGTGGFTIVLCALKALLEHEVVLTAVADRFPKGLGH